MVEEAVSICHGSLFTESESNQRSGLSSMLPPPHRPERLNLDINWFNLYITVRKSLSKQLKEACKFEADCDIDQSNKLTHEQSKRHIVP